MRGRLSLFSKKNIEEALAAHADSLIRGGDEGERLLARYPRERESLEELFVLGRRLRDALTPVQVSYTFVSELKAQLSEARARLEAEERQRERRRLAWQIAGVAGLMLSGIAMLALGVRFIIALVSRRRATTAV